jgi:hypothetical protein
MTDKRITEALKGVVLVKSEEKKGEPLFKKELPGWRIEAELQRKIATECGKRCLMHRAAAGVEREDKLKAGEELCLNRCISKVMNVKEIVDTKLRGRVELPPILFNQNLP